MRKILITGGAGFIGSRLALELLGRGYSVRVLDNLSPQIHGNVGDSYSFNLIKGKVDFVHGDVRTRKDWVCAIEGMDAIVHLAAETGTGQSMYQIYNYSDVNIGGTALMLDVLTNAKHSISKLIVASSRAIYGEGKYKCSEHGVVYPKGRKEDNLKKGIFDPLCPVCAKPLTVLPTDEESLLSPNSFYGITKQVQEQMVLLGGKSLNIPSIALRYQNVYGPGQSLSNPYTGILSIFSTRILHGKGIEIFEDGKESRDFVSVQDVTTANVCALEYNQPIWDAFNVGTGIGTSVLEVANTLNQAYKGSVSLDICGKYRVGDIRHNIADVSKLSKTFGFKPEISFQTGIEQFVGWVITQSVPEDQYERSLKELATKGLYK